MESRERGVAGGATVKKVADLGEVLKNRSDLLTEEVWSMDSLS